MTDSVKWAIFWAAVVALILLGQYPGAAGLLLGAMIGRLMR